MGSTALLAELRRELAKRGFSSMVDVRRLRKEWTKRLADAPAVLAVARGLLSSHVAGEWLFGCELVMEHEGARKALRGNALRELGQGLSSWHEVDCFACFLAGPAWREGRVRDGEIARWARSKDRWWRRAALVSTVPLNNRARGATALAGDAERTLAVCERLLDDRDDMVVKALSWALRELAKRDRASVERFLERHGDRVSARIRREVGNKLATGRKDGRTLAAPA